MYKIQEAEMLANNIYRMVVEAPRVAQHCLPGQFVIVKADEEGERIPLTICDYDREAGTITIVFMPIGESTKKMKDLKAGDAFMDFVGPLGQPSEFCSEVSFFYLCNECRNVDINRASCDTFCIFTAQAALCFFYCFVFVVSKTYLVKICGTYLRLLLTYRYSV